MRLLFIIPGHQGGRCGIVDYAFWVAIAAAESGASVRLVNLHDIGPAEEAYGERVPVDMQARVKLVSIGGDLRERISQLGPLLEDFRPDWVSLQFTPGIFRRGRFFYPSMRQLGIILRGYRVTVTVHETWRGLVKQRTARAFWLLWLRRLELKSGLHALNPRCLFSSNPTHQYELRTQGLNAVLLPIFSTVRRHEAPNDVSTLTGFLKRIGEPLAEAMPDNPLVAVLFARIEADWRPEKLLRALLEHAAAEGRPLVIVSAGEVGHEGKGWDQVKANAGDAICLKLGTRSAAEISWLLQVAHLGLSSTPISLWLKSSSCAAMVEHDLRVVFSADKVPADIQLPPSYGLVRDGRLVFLQATSAQCISSRSPRVVWSKMNQVLAAKIDKNREITG